MPLVPALPTLLTRRPCPGRFTGLLSRHPQDPDAAAGRRVVAFPALLNTEVAQHLGQFVGEHDDALVFASPVGVPMRHSNFYRRAWWPRPYGSGSSARMKLRHWPSVRLSSGLSSSPKCMTRLRNMGAKLPDSAALETDGQFHIFRVMSTTALLAARECLPDLVSQPLVSEFDSETGFGSLLDVIHGDPGG